MTPYVMPARKWADDEPQEALRPVVLVSSRDGHPVPPVAAAVRLAKAADAAGWTARATYALADVPQGWNRCRKDYRLASVGVRFARAGVRGWACWYEVDDGGWKFAVAYLGRRKLGARELTKALFEVTP
jgi:hypothetical protein